MNTGFIALHRKLLDSPIWQVTTVELGKKAAAPKAPAESVAANTDVNPVKLEYVKFTGTQCLIQSNKGKWYRVEDLPVKHLENITNDGHFAAGYDAIRATINGKAAGITK